jgi:predicted nucleic-acid-binding Zn-ribbon protein
MGNFGKALKRAAKAFAGANGPGEYEAGGKKVACPHCGASEFAEGRAQLNTAGMTFLGLDWANESATTLACTNCGRVEWFLKPPERL